MEAQTKRRKVTVKELQRKTDAGERIVAVTAYDALTARIVDSVGVDVILVGDSLGMTVLGYENTIPVTIEDCLHHAAAVTRARPAALVVGDMPFLTYQVSPEQALVNAGRFLQGGGTDAVKLEGGKVIASTIRRLVQAGIPVLGHIGVLPQAVLAEGGYRVQGRTAEEAAALEADALAVQEAGAFALVLECLPMSLSARITEELDIPTIGIGAGPHCAGQIQVLYDIVGLFEEFVPRHTKRYAFLAEVMREALGAYLDEVRSGVFPAEEQSFK